MTRLLIKIEFDFSIETVSLCLSDRILKRLSASSAVNLTFAPVGSLMTKMKSSENAWSCTPDCQSCDRIAFATRFQNMEPEQNPRAQTCSYFSIEDLEPFGWRLFCC
ncbi:hypothetical protein AVEN_2580-1 [Araneus ventricosus]|uniref:Uncharacterized protein n=1 Tax=Araneus ventricosus TaxID=182803 RepID=A0A4Y2GRU9_ARAVE|nr:hypothetical protein AVEN_2580-1 [Araneus ventricosus]